MCIDRCIYFCCMDTCAYMYIYLHWCMKCNLDMMLCCMHTCAHTYKYPGTHTHTYVCVCADKWSAHSLIIYLFVYLLLVYAHMGRATIYFFIHWYLKCVWTYCVYIYYCCVHTCDVQLYFYALISEVCFDIWKYALIFAVYTHVFHNYIFSYIDIWIVYEHILYVFIFAVYTHVTYNYIFLYIDIWYVCFDIWCIYIYIFIYIFIYQWILHL